jgi:DNA-binding response OmpR family regulator
VTKILIVEDDQAQSRLLSRAICQRRPDYRVLTASNGRDAIKLLEREEVALVLTDLQMPEINGFELLAWLGTNRPSLIVFTMTAYGNAETEARLSSLGSIECFTKPIDIASVLDRLDESMSQSIRGHVQNVSLTTFLQLIGLEKKTCTLTVRFNEKSGHLFLRKGELVHAKTADLSGEAAATTIIGWPHVSIMIEGVCAEVERSIHASLSHVMMEAVRMHDETVRDSVPDSERPTSVFPAGKDSFFPMISLPPSAHPPRQASRPPIGVLLPEGALVLAVVDTATGSILSGSSRKPEGLPAAAAEAADILRRQLDIPYQERKETIQELSLNTSSRCELIRPIAQPSGRFALLIYDPRELTQVMARLEMDAFVTHYLGSLGSA